MSFKYLSSLETFSELIVSSLKSESLIFQVLLLLYLVPVYGIEDCLYKCVFLNLLKCLIKVFYFSHTKNCQDTIVYGTKITETFIALPEHLRL